MSINECIKLTVCPENAECQILKVVIVVTVLKVSRETTLPTSMSLTKQTVVTLMLNVRTPTEATCVVANKDTTEPVVGVLRVDV